jgi:alginate O-acetyltransferase complex protein AlgI
LRDISLSAYLIDAPSARLNWLAAASLVFYGYWDVRFVPIIVASIVFNYPMGLLVRRQSRRFRSAHHHRFHDSSLRWLEART